ncbi:LxmA leader domain family RiPP [Streptomyces sp. NPDC127098]
MNTDSLFEGYTSYTDAGELAASVEAEEAPATIALTVGTAILTFQIGC